GGGEEEEEGAGGRRASLRARRGAREGARPRRYRVVLPDDPAVQRLFHPRELLGFLLLELPQRDAGPAGDDELDVFFLDRLGALALVLLPLALELLVAVAEHLLLLTDRGGLLDLLGLQGHFFLA